LNKSEIFPGGNNYETNVLDKNFAGAPRKQHPAANGQSLFAYLTNNSQESSLEQAHPIFNISNGQQDPPLFNQGVGSGVANNFN